MHRRTKRELDARAATGTIGCDEAGLPHAESPCRTGGLSSVARYGRDARARRAGLAKARARRGERRLLANLMQKALSLFEKGPQPLPDPVWVH